MVIGLIDIIVIITLVLSVLFALYRGLVCELLCISSWILAGFGGLYSFAPMTKLLKGVFDNEVVAGVVGSAIVVLLILVFMTVVNAQITKRLRTSSLSGLDRLLGLAFGFLRAALLLSLLYVAGSIVLSETQMKNLAKNNVSVPYIQKSVDLLKYIVPDTVLSSLNIQQKSVKSEEKPKIGTDLKRKSQPKNTDKSALNKLIEEVKAPAKPKAPATNNVPTVKEEVKKIVKEEVKKEIIKEVEKKVEPVKQEAVTYKSSERESMDIMIEAIAGE